MGPLYLFPAMHLFTDIAVHFVFEVAVSFQLVSEMLLKKCNSLFLMFFISDMTS